jgi:predicted  nucleic acid-binding Zn-ribbon protein
MTVDREQATRWITDGQSALAMIADIVRDHRRLESELHTARERIDHLQGTVQDLTDELQRYRKERDEVLGLLARVHQVLPGAPP